MRNFQLAAKLFFKDIFLVISVIAFFIFINYNQINSLSMIGPQNTDGAMLQLWATLRIAIFCFVFLMFISYEYFYKLKASNLEECVKSTNTGLQSLYGNQLLVMLCLAGVMTLAFLAYNMGAYFFLKTNKTEYLIHILLNVFINIFIVSCLGIIIGMFSALVFKRMKAYLLMTLFALLTSVVFENVVFTIFNTTGNDIYPLFEFFNLYTPSLHWTRNFNFGFSLLPYRIELIFIWIFAFSSIIFLKLSTNKNKNVFKVLAGLCFIICTINAVLYVQPSSKVLMSNNPSACLTNDALYYFETLQKEEPAAFEITKYELDMKVGNALSVEAKLTLNKGDLPKYTFTLYRGYQVTKVTNQNNEVLKYQQSGDYIEVENKNQSNLSSVNISYTGYSPKFYSNSQGICLPGFFPYYPHSGYIKLFNVKDQGFEKNLLTNPVEFTVNIKAPKQVFSNLTENEEGSFYGITNGITFMSGFIEKSTIEGIEIIYPYLYTDEYSPDKLEALTKAFVESKKDDLVIRKIFILPNLNLSNYESTVVYSDYITARQMLNLPEKYVIQEINKNKLILYQLVNMYLYETKDFDGYISYEASPNYIGEKLATLLSDRIKTLGEKLTLEKANAYIEDDTDKRTILEFLNQLQ